MLTIDIAISTYKPEGIQRLASHPLPKMPGVRYVVSWQLPQMAAVPASFAEREDIVVYRFDTPGQSHNRNNALSHCDADIVIISDDDVTFLPEGIERLREAYQRHPEMDVATFRSIHDSSVVYPASETPLGCPLPKGYYVCCIELSMSRKAAQTLRFNPELGLNSPRMHGAEDEIMLLTAIKRQMDVRFIPTTVCEHPHPSTGLKCHHTPENLRATGCSIALYYPASALPRILLKAIRLRKHSKDPLLKSLFYMIQGWAETPAFKRRTRQYLWRED